MTQHNSIGLFVGLAVFFLVQGVFWLRRGRRRRREAELIRLMRAVEFDDAVGVESRKGHRGEGWAERWDSLRRLGRVLAQAGLNVSVSRFVGGLGSALALVVVVVGLATGNPLGGLVLDLAIVVFVYLYISNKRRNRLTSIDQQLPQALELMVFSLRAGHPLESAIRFVAKELPDPLGCELRRCHEEYEMGRPLEAALVGLATRLDACRALGTFVEAVVVLKQTGGNLVEVVEQIVTTLRAQAAYEARYRALTAEGRTSGLILGSLPLLILAAVLLVQPGYLGSLFSTSGGRVVLMVAFALWGLGIAWLMRLVRPAV
jgi:tight adherence protein B